MAGRSRTGLGGSGALAEGCRAAPGFSVPIRLDAAFAARCNTRPLYGGQVAQLVEQRTENPRVGGSIPPLATINSLNLNDFKSDCAAEIRWLCRICAVNFCRRPAHLLGVHR